MIHNLHSKIDILQEQSNNGNQADRDTILPHNVGGIGLGQAGHLNLQGAPTEKIYGCQKRCGNDGPLE